MIRPSRAFQRALALTLGTGLVASTIVVAGSAGSGEAMGNSAPAAPERLTVEDQESPLNIEGAPRFGWLPQDADGNEVQTAYEIEVRDGEDDTVWSSGKVASGQQSYVDYAGPALEPASGYSWRVRTWDKADAGSPWAEAAAFETGIANNQWGGAEWIRRQPGALGATGPLTILDGRARLTGANLILSKTRAPSPDYTIDVDVTPRANSAHIIFRAPDNRNGYMWSLVPGAGVRHHLMTNNAFPNADRVTFPATIAIGTTYHLKITVAGNQITGYLDGAPIGTVTHAAHAGLNFGFRTGSNETAEFDNYTVTSPSGEVLFTDDFSTGLAKWDVPLTQEADEFTWARKQVDLPAGQIVRARSFFAADDTYELWVNGQRADRSMNAGYQGEQFYQAADVTDLLDEGRPNVLGVVARWSGSGQGRAAGVPGILGKVIVEYADGRLVTINTDATWRTRPGDHIGVGTRNGEGLYITHQSAPLAAAAGTWKQPGYDASAWGVPIVHGAHPTGGFTYLQGKQTRVTETEVRPERILIAEDGTPVADFGKVIPARPVVRFENGVAGRTLPIRAGYRLAANGRTATDSVTTQSTDMRFIYTQVAGRQTFRAFDHLGFRYLEIPGAGEEITVDDVAGVVLHAELPQDAIADFDSDDQTLDDVYELMQRSLLYSVQDTFVDTPTREQGQFLLDTANISYGLMSSLGDRNATRQAMQEFIWSQSRYWSTGNDAGRYNAVYPNGDGKRDIPDFSQLVPDWVWRTYLESGDKAILTSYYDEVVATAGYVRRHIPATGATAGLVTRLTGGSGQYAFGIVDWPASGRFGYDMNAWARTSVNALGVNVFRTASLMAEALGRPASEADGFTREADNLADRMNATLRRPDGIYIDGLSQAGVQSSHAGQHSNSYAIAFGIAPRADWPALAEYIAGMGMKQGPMTSHWLVKALIDAGAEDDALHLLTNEQDLGWAKLLADGETFTTEAWVMEGSANSASHGWGAQAIVDIQEDLLGIEVTKPGASEVTLRVTESGLGRASGSRWTQRGPVSSEWSNGDGGVSLKTSVPVNVSAVVELPSDETYDVTGPAGSAAELIDLRGDTVRYRIGSGSWTFSSSGVRTPQVVYGAVSAGGAPVADACVYLYASRQAASASYAGCTLSDGTYLIPDVAAGTYEVAVADPSGRLRTQWRATPLAVEGAAPVGGVDAELVEEQSGALTGAVSDSASGSPLATVCAFAYDRGDPVAAQYATCTDAAGAYGIYGADSGAYDVAFFDPSGRYPTRWWTGAGTGSDAQSGAAPVVVPTSGGNVRADQALAPAGTGTVAGVVSGPTGPVPGACVYLYASIAGPASYGTCTQADGSFWLGGVAPGSYKVAYVDPSAAHVTQWWNSTPTGAPSWVGGTTVTVNGGETTGVNALLTATTP